MNTGEIDTSLLAGLSIAQWLTEQPDAAINTYRQLILIDRRYRNVDWADPEYIAYFKWPPSRTKPLEAVRVATLAKHPELAAPPVK